ncbi:hypothetical protein B0J13DRAFT_574242 [Dactylonectria estremocensis]|uniref:Uncharacterized protein n=1 Tax=Dactylonectria estremocensis TaxID=1079267 RepID=A0A9P9IBI3_9HYPO|nr:hypothetical protein B0J13DRAFT_574242 [Dactylonectria estremocensis]
MASLRRPDGLIALLGALLSFYKTQSNIPELSLPIKRQWDIDSISLGAKSLHAIRPPSHFRLSFLPPIRRNISTDQVIQPHGLDLATTRHILFGSLSTIQDHLMDNPT